MAIHPCGERGWEISYFGHLPILCSPSHMPKMSLIHIPRIHGYVPSCVEPQGVIHFTLFRKSNDVVDTVDFSPKQGPFLFGANAVEGRLRSWNSSDTISRALRIY